MSKIKNSGLDHYIAEPCEQQQFGKAGIEGVNMLSPISVSVTVLAAIAVLKFLCQCSKCNLYSFTSQLSLTTHGMLVFFIEFTLHQDSL